MGHFICLRILFYYLASISTFDPMLPSKCTPIYRCIRRPVQQSHVQLFLIPSHCLKVRRMRLFFFGRGSSGLVKDCASLFLWYLHFDSPSINKVTAAFSANCLLTCFTISCCIPLFSFLLSVKVFFFCSPLDLTLTMASVKEVFVSFA